GARGSRWVPCPLVGGGRGVGVRQRIPAPARPRRFAACLPTRGSVGPSAPLGPIPLRVNTLYIVRDIDLIGGFSVVDSVLAAVRVGPSKTEIREYPMPDVPDDAALMKVEAAGICGTDGKRYKHPPTKDPVNIDNA